MRLIWDINKIENEFKICLKHNSVSLGLDTASKTGVCVAKTDDKKLVLDISVIDIDVSKIENKEERNNVRYDMIYKNFKETIKSEYNVVIEDVFYSRNPQTLILLSRIGAIAYTICKQKKVKKIIWKTAVQARKALGLKCNVKKEVIVQEVNRILKTDIKNNDIIDSIVLAINGLIDNE